jgi:hypothetical protein
MRSKVFALVGVMGWVMTLVVVLGGSAFDRMWPKPAMNEGLEGPSHGAGDGNADFTPSKPRLETAVIFDVQDGATRWILDGAETRGAARAGTFSTKE